MKEYRKHCRYCGRAGDQNHSGSCAALLTLLDNTTRSLIIRVNTR